MRQSAISFQPKSLIFCMSHLVLVFWRICIFRGGPDAIPANRTLLSIIVILNAILSISLYLTINRTGFLTAATVVTVSLAGTAGLVWLIMNVMDLAARFPQTLMALLGVDLLNTVLTGAVALLTLTNEGVLSPTGAAVLAALMFWNLAIFAFIFHRALNIHFGFGLMLAFFVVIFSVAISQVAAAP